MNPPSASHRGGVWERQIRSFHAILCALLQSSGQQLDDELLRTFMYEAEAIVNSRPLTTDKLTTLSSQEPLTPDHLLTMKSNVLLPPPGDFKRADLYSRKRWRRVQHLANDFWNRWKKDFLQSLQEHQKWNHVHPNIQTNDIALLKDDNLPRNEWQLARVVEAEPDSDGLVQKVKITVADRSLDQSGQRVKPPCVLERPIQKLVLLVACESS